MVAMTTVDEQYLQVYEGICAVAARCDGAQSLDYKGFDGQDTHFGRRIASVPFEEWTDAVKEEAARIANKYQRQIAEYTGLDITALQVVKDAEGTGTVYAARDDARQYERRARNAALADERLVDVQADGKFTFAWAKKDPDFAALLSGVKALPGRSFNWDRKVNVVPRSEALEDFIQTWDFPLTERARKALSEEYKAPEVWNITLLDGDGGKVRIDTPYEPRLVEAIRHLPGRRYIAGSINHANVDPMVVMLADEYNLKIHPDARAACTAALEAQKVAREAAAASGDRRAVMALVSRCGNPEQLPEAFLSLLDGVLK